MANSEEYLRIHKKGDLTTIKGQVSGYSYLDKDTKMQMIYVPSLDISGYGDTLEEAMQMVQWSINEYTSELCKLSVKDIKAELILLGWTKQKLKNKIYFPNFDPMKRLDDEGIENYDQTPIPIAA